jgi:hypothetical protein
MGLEPEVGERKFPGTVYWVDVALTSRAQKPPAGVSVRGYRARQGRNAAVSGGVAAAGWSRAG